MQKKCRIKSLIAISIIINISIAGLPIPARAAGAGTGTVSQVSADNSSNSVYSTQNEYDDYLARHKDDPMMTADPVLLPAVNAVPGSGASFEKNFLSKDKDAVVISDEGAATWSFTMPQTAMCEIDITYMAAAASGGDLEIGISIDDSTPYGALSAVGFKRTYKQDAISRKDSSGNDIQPEVNEILQWATESVRDSSGYITEPYQIALTQGTHTIQINGSRGDIAIASISLRPSEKVQDYNAYLKAMEVKGAGAHGGDQVIPIQGENFQYKSDTTILPAADTSSPDTRPVSSFHRLLNTVGGDNWNIVGSSVSWQITVPATGFYKLAIRYKQNTKSGIFTSRKLLIDHELPFQEAAQLRFNYSDSWEVAQLGKDGTPYLFYLTQGSHLLTLEAVMGDNAELIGNVEKSLVSLNSIYRKIVMITGTDPDIYRDYNFTNLIPDQLAEMKTVYQELSAAAENIKKQAGVDKSYVSVIQKLLYEIKHMTDSPESLAKYLVQFKTDLGALGTWILSASQQPLQIDVIYMMQTDAKTPAANSGFLNSIWFGIKMIVMSFFNNYSSLGVQANSSYTQSLKVWTQTGRDQAEILRQLVYDDFAEKYKAKVNIQVVAPGTLLQSALAGDGPDVVLNNASSDPINFAIRNATLDLTQFQDYQQTADYFFDSAIEPFKFDGKVYALPETFSFPMFFYRKDIFKEYGFKVPKTWEDLLLLIPALQGKGMSLAFPTGLVGYATVLYQNNGTLYQNAGAKTNLGSEEALDSFEQFTDLFTLHDLSVQYDFPNRFRTGEMPCGIADYTIYNNLTVFAPEIKGDWDMVPIPGKVNPDGTINNKTAGTSVGTMILSSTRSKELSWEFVQWWLSAKVQGEYGRQLESVLGAAAKYPTANKQALTQMTWNHREYTNLLEQEKNVEAIPEVPGGYYLPRIITFAFNKTYNNLAEDPDEVLKSYILELNDELTRKRHEFGLN